MSSIKRILPITLVLLLASMQPAWAVRVLRQIESSYELSLTSVRLPRSPTGSIVFTPCESCLQKSVPVGPATRYFVEGQAVTQAQLLQAAGQIRQSFNDAEHTLVMLHYDIETGVTTRLSLKTYTSK